MTAAVADRSRGAKPRTVVARSALVLVAFLVAHSVDTGSASAEQYPIRLFDSAAGLPVDGATEAIIDRDGYLWLNSGGYVARFDGVEFDLFGADRGLKGKPQALAQSGDGTIWVGTRAGLQYLEPNGDGLIHSLPKDAPLAADRINAICSVSPTELAVAGSQSVWKVTGSPTGLGARLVYQSPESRGISSVDCDRTGTVWVSNFNDALGRISPDDSATTFLIKGGALAKAPRGAALDRFGHLWVSTWDGVCIGDAAAPPGADFCRVFFRSVGSKLVSFGTGVTALGDGSIVIAANDLLRFEAQAELSAPQSVTSIGKTQGLDYGELIVGLEDRFGNVWVTDSRRGLWRVALRGSRSFDSGQISSPLIVQALKQLRDGTMLAVGNSLEETREPHRVLHWNGREWLESRYPHPAGQVDTAWGVNQIVIEDANGAAWFAADDGLRGYRAGTRLDQLDAAHSDYFIGPKQNLPADQPMRVWADSHGLWWITYLNHDPYRFDPRTKQSTRLNLDSPPGESDRKRPRAYLEDDRGLVWFAYARGIGRPRADDSWEYVPIPDLAGFGNTEDIAFDSSGALWIATGVGLFHTSDPRAASPSFTRVWPAPGVIPRIVLAIKVSKTGQLYAGSDVGVLVFDITTRMIEQYGAGSGLPGSSVTALELDADGKMWVGTTRGIAILPTLELPPSEVPDPLLVRVTTPLRQLPLMLAGQRLLTGLTLQPDERALDVFVRSIVMQADRRVSYRTRLDGVDRDWSPPSTQRQLRIAGLSTGHYSLRIRAEDQTGRVSNNEARIDFDVRAPFYERPWFAAAILGAIALGALVWQRQQAQRALAIERTRTTIATDLHDEIGAGLSRIAVLSESLARGRRAADRTDRDRSDHDRSEPTRADSSPEVTPNQIAEIARRLVDRMSDLVWAINPERDRAFSLVQRMRRFATPLLRARGIALQLRAIDEEHDRALDGELRRELLLIFQESINNAVKHSECSRVTVDLAFEADRIVLTVADDGRGFVVEGTAEGTGLSSIRKRAARLGGTCDINAVAAEGTRIRVSAPLKRRR